MKYSKLKYYNLLVIVSERKILEYQSIFNGKFDDTWEDHD